jgi:C4-dicarboxylate-specific signal transduction histidine kinase
MRTVDANDAAVRLVGAADATEAIAGRARIFLPETVRTWRDLLIALAEGRPSFAGETVLQTIGGERRSVLLTATFPADGVRSTGLLSAVDITERQALAEARAELAHVSRVVTLGELTASIAHEVKQPLAAIVTDAQACRRWLDRPVPALDEARACAGRIAGQANRADHVVQRLRDLTRKAEPERVPVDPSIVVDEVVELMRHEIADHGVALRTRLAPGLPPVAGDRIQLQQVLINLVVNAIQAMAAAPGRSWSRSRTAASG